MQLAAIDARPVAASAVAAALMVFGRPWLIQLEDCLYTFRAALAMPGISRCLA
jgi:hypothetical protein